MLALTFAFIRLGVSLVLKLVRLRARPTPKILRDVLDGTLYLVATLVIVQREFRDRPVEPARRLGDHLGGRRPRAPGDAGKPLRRPRHPAGAPLPGGRHHLGGPGRLRPHRADRLAGDPGGEQAAGDHLAPQHHLQQAGGEELLARQRAGGLRHLRRAHLRDPAQPGEGGHPRDPGRGAADPLRARRPDPHLAVRPLGHQVPHPLLRVGRGPGQRRPRRDPHPALVPAPPGEHRDPLPAAGRPPALPRAAGHGVPGQRAHRPARRGGHLPGARPGRAGAGGARDGAPAGSAAASGSSSRAPRVRPSTWWPRGPSPSSPPAGSR